jgi:glycosyltransferase involved in cell wall biosynthesis
MICILHGYLLEGSGSNLWTRAIVESLCRDGERVHLMAQENHPDRYPFIAEAYSYAPDGTRALLHRQESAYDGSCVLHKPLLGDLLPVYVRDRYEEFPRAVPMVELPDEEIEEYLDRNTRALLEIVEREGITSLHANHSVLMSTVAHRVHRATGVPFAVMPHGSALEFAVKRDSRFHALAEEAMAAADRIFVHGDEMRGRVLEALPALESRAERFSELHLGVDTALFTPVDRPERAASVTRMLEALRETPRGRTAGQTERLLRDAPRASGESELEAVFEAARAFDGKAPDADLEEKLGTIDWARERTLLFVGRIISTKGIHGVIAALPFLLREVPDLRLLVVGHGPLREPLEALVQALGRGDRQMVELIVSRGRRLEGSPEGDSEGTQLTQAALYLDRLREEERLDDYFQTAREHLRPERVIFTGYLTHRELRFLFPCCDAAVFPSVVKEAGPLVFLEALASAAFPLGTYFGGMQASIDSIADALPREAIEAMKLSADPAETVRDMVEKTPAALRLSERVGERMNRVARDRFDWRSVARQLRAELEAM